MLLTTSQPTLDVTVSESARKYLLNSRSKHTRQGYHSDLKHFVAYCDSQNLCALPATPATVAGYLVMMAEAGFKTATLSRRLAAIAKAHSTDQLDSPASMKHSVVKEVWTGIRRTIGTAQTAKAAATSDYLKLMLAQVPVTLTGSRDRALLLATFAGALRRSEVVALNVEDVAYVPEGLVVTIRSSKTDQERAGQKVAVALGRVPETCPVRSLRAEGWDHEWPAIPWRRSLGQSANWSVDRPGRCLGGQEVRAPCWLGCHPILRRFVACRLGDQRF